MREFKIRIWDVKLNGWYYTVPGKPEDHNVLDTWYFENVYQDEEDYIWEQYTGLKDKNGKEIYEGDIVRIDSLDELRTGYVDLVNDQYCIVCGVDEDGYKIVAEFYYYSKPEENCEVIGNIHENKELLK